MQAIVRNSRGCPRMRETERSDGDTDRMENAGASRLNARRPAPWRAVNSYDLSAQIV